ncbi:alpha/beta fold hydrolase [Nocardiopsis potens]|uniref:alpha/beta fold hydrolase n=1 Tax=Nocardiopsis potens TaxID=1246458 RepID=UPI00034B636B|nr:alpha/beta hydrolase [Nocardiopsis potens]
MPIADVPLSAGVGGVHYLRAGTGTGLVLVHGTGATAEGNWAPLAEAAADRFTVVAPDLSGSGATTDPGGPITVDDLVAEVLGAARHAGLDRFHLVGHSLGAVVATAVAGTVPDRVLSLTAHAGWVRTDPHMAFQFDLWLRLMRIDPGLQARLLQATAMGEATLRSRTAADFEAAAAGFAALLDGAADGFVRQVEADLAVDVAALLPEITAPTLLISGTDDRIVPPRHQEEQARLIPHAELLRLPGGHALPFEAPEAFTSAVLDHLDRRPAPAR